MSCRQSQDPPPALLIDGRQRSQDFAKRHILQYRTVPRRSERETHYVTVCMGKAGEGQRDDGEVRQATRRSIGRVAADDFGNLALKSEPSISAQQRIPQRFGDESAGANVRHLARDMFEDQPAITEDVVSFGLRLWRWRHACAGKWFPSCVEVSAQFLKAARVDAPLRRLAVARRERTVVDQEMTTREARRMADIGCVARDNLQRRERRLIRFGLPPEQTDDGIMRARSGKAARLAAAESGQNAFGVLLLITAGIIRRDENNNPRARLRVRRKMTRCWQRLQPFKRLPFIFFFAARGPTGDKSGEDAVGLRRPVRRVAVGADGGKRDSPRDIRSQELNSFWPAPSSSPPLSARASFWLSRTISTSLSCGLSSSGFDERAKPALRAAS